MLRVRFCLERVLCVLIQRGRGTCRMRRPWLSEQGEREDSPPFVKRRMVPPGWGQDAATDEGGWNQRGSRF